MEANERMCTVCVEDSWDTENLTRRDTVEMKSVLVLYCTGPSSNVVRDDKMSVLSLPTAVAKRALRNANDADASGGTDIEGKMVHIKTCCRECTANIRHVWTVFRLNAFFDAGLPVLPGRFTFVGDDGVAKVRSKLFRDVTPRRCSLRLSISALVYAMAMFQEFGRVWCLCLVENDAEPFLVAAPIGITLEYLKKLIRELGASVGVNVPLPAKDHTLWKVLIFSDWFYHCGCHYSSLVSQYLASHSTLLPNALRALGRIFRDLLKSWTQLIRLRRSSKSIL